jgi:flagellin-specific chaperone FliS
MNPYQAYRQRQADGWTRIDRLLALFDGLLDRAERALGLLHHGDGSAARSVLVNARVLLDGLTAGVVPDGGEAAADLLRHHEFIGHRLSAGRAEHIEATLPVLRNLRQGFLAIRSQALSPDGHGEGPALEGGGLVPAPA